jgi:hypothetical protein
MSGPTVFDHAFVSDQLRPVAMGRRALVDPPGVTPALTAAVSDRINGCLELYDQHRGVPLAGVGPVPSEHRAERLLLNYALSIVGHVLNLEGAVRAFESVIETDWKAHVELRGQKRYRDHITHPVCVTAVGWWLLHRNGGALLADLARYYEASTEGYRVGRGVDVSARPWRAIVEYAWLTCGLLHDSAYSLEYHLLAGEKLCAECDDPLRLFAPTRQRFSTGRGRRAFLKRLRPTWTAAQTPDLEGRLAALCTGARFRHAHALLGALHNLLSLDSARLHSLQGLVVQLAARAIISHHDSEDTAIVADPLALLLFVADNLQAWGRPFLHRESGTDRSARIRPVIECNSIKLVSTPSGYTAQFQMNEGEMDLLKSAPYGWKLSKFGEPNRRVERLLGCHQNLPRIELSHRHCIQPTEFLDFMEAGAGA